MDPNKVVFEFLWHVNVGHCEEAARDLHVLFEWIDKGGFLPAQAVQHFTDAVTLASMIAERQIGDELDARTIQLAKDVVSHRGTFSR